MKEKKLTIVDLKKRRINMSKYVEYPSLEKYIFWYQKKIKGCVTEDGYYLGIKQFQHISKYSSEDYNAISNCPGVYPIDSVLSTLEENDDNKDAIEIIKARFDDKLLNKKGLLICGSNGIGKTVIARELIKKHNNMYRCFFAESYKLIQCIRSSWKNDTSEEFVENLSEADLLAIDDILKFDKERDSELIEEFFCDRMEYRPTIFTTNLDTETFAEKYPAFWSRINEFCETVELIGEDFRMKQKQKIRRKPK